MEERLRRAGVFLVPLLLAVTVAFALLMIGCECPVDTDCPCLRVAVQLRLLARGMTPRDDMPVSLVNLVRIKQILIPVK